jgi:signal transduction histidine kinase
VSILLSINDRVRVSDNSSALHLFRIVQEALNNAIKHAHADQIQVSVGIEAARGCIIIHDNGTGFRQQSDKSAGLGLRIMQHRCGLIDAEFKIESPPGGGTEIKCYFPVE